MCGLYDASRLLPLTSSSGSYLLTVWCTFASCWPRYSTLGELGVLYGHGTIRTGRERDLGGTETTAGANLVYTQLHGGSGYLTGPLMDWANG